MNQNADNLATTTPATAPVDALLQARGLIAACVVKVESGQAMRLRGVLATLAAEIELLSPLAFRTELADLALTKRNTRPAARKPSVPACPLCNRPMASTGSPVRHGIRFRFFACRACGGKTTIRLRADSVDNDSMGI
jgi:hypothetical protein